MKPLANVKLLFCAVQVFTPSLRKFRGCLCVRVMINVASNPQISRRSSFLSAPGRVSMVTGSCQTPWRLCSSFHLLLPSHDVVRAYQPRECSGEGERSRIVCDWCSWVRLVVACSCRYVGRKRSKCSRRHFLSLGGPIGYVLVVCTDKECPRLSFSFRSVDVDVANAAAGAPFNGRYCT